MVGLKGILVIIDGLGDLPCKELNNKTPLEAAAKPNLDFFSARGEIGYMYPVKPGYVPESHESILSIFGNNINSVSRGQLEAIGAGIKLEKGDLAFRVNFASINNLQSRNIIDRRAGRNLTTEEAEILAKDINKNVKLPIPFIFKSTIQHRGVLVFKGNFSDNISSNETAYSENGNFGQKIQLCKPVDKEENSLYTASIVNDFLKQSYLILEKHSVNEERKKRRLLPANFLLLRGAGVQNIKLNVYNKWEAIVYMPLEIGFAKASKMNAYSFNYPRSNEKDVYFNIYDGLKCACDYSIKMIKKLYKKVDYLYIHIKETDLAGHDNKPFEKKEMIEFIDYTLFEFLKDFAPKNKIKVIVTGDHSTPCRLKMHSADPVPVLVYNFQLPNEKIFDEKNSRIGSLGRLNGSELLFKAGFFN